jgi:hypothetical protein
MLQRVADQSILRLFALVFNCTVALLKIARNGHHAEQRERERHLACSTDSEGLAAQSVLPL